MIGRQFSISVDLMLLVIKKVCPTITCGLFGLSPCQVARLYSCLGSIKSKEMT